MKKREVITTLFLSYSQLCLIFSLVWFSQVNFAYSDLFLAKQKNTLYPELLDSITEFLMFLSKYVYWYKLRMFLEKNDNLQVIKCWPSTETNTWQKGYF